MSNEKLIEEIMSALVPVTADAGRVARGTEYFLMNEARARATGMVASFEVNRALKRDEAFRANQHMKSKASRSGSIYQVRRDGRGHQQIHAQVSMHQFGRQFVLGPVVNAGNANRGVLREVRRNALAEVTQHTGDGHFWVASSPDSQVWGDQDIISEWGCESDIRLKARERAAMQSMTGGIKLFWARGRGDAMVALNSPAKSKWMMPFRVVGMAMDGLLSRMKIKVKVKETDVTISADGGTQRDATDRFAGEHAMPIDAIQSRDDL